MENHIIINIGRQLGSGGREIGKKLADRLGIAFFDKNLIELSAQKSGLCKECFEKADEKPSKGLLGSFFSMRYPYINAGYSNVNFANNDTLFKIQSDVIKSLADKQACVFVGRCADYVLREYPNTINLFISSTKTDKIARLCARHNIGEDEAEEKSEKVDKGRSQFYNYYSYQTWGTAETYDLCINSSLFGIDGTVDFLVDFVEKRIEQGEPFK